MRTANVVNPESVKHAVEVLEITYRDFLDHRNSVSSDLRGHYDACLSNLDRQIHFLKTLYESKA